MTNLKNYWMNKYNIDDRVVIKSNGIVGEIAYISGDKYLVDIKQSNILIKNVLSEYEFESLITQR